MLDGRLSWGQDWWKNTRRKILSSHTTSHSITWRINYQTKKDLARLLVGYKACLEKDPSSPTFRVQVPLVEILLEGTYVDTDDVLPIQEKMQIHNTPMSIADIQAIALQTLRILLGRSMVVEIHGYEERRDTQE